MDNIINRSELRRLEKAARDKNKDKLLEWIIQFDNQIRMEYENTYKKELADSIDNFCTAVAYTARFSETTHLGPKKLPEFMDDLFVTIDMFRVGEFKPEDYEEELRKCGINKMYYHIKQNPYKIITLCGDLKFKDEFLLVQQKLTLDNWIVIPTGLCYNDTDFILTDKQKVDFYDLMCQKIRLSNALYVINKEGYIDDITEKLIEFAKKNKKTIYYLEQEANDEDYKN